MKAIFKYLAITFLLSTVSLAQQFVMLGERVVRKDSAGIQHLLNQGIDIDVRQSSTGATVLMLASSYYGYEDMVEYLIMNGADVNASDNNGKTALIWAVSNSLESARLLIMHGANLNAKENNGMTPFLQAVFGILSDKVQIEMCDLLKENGADINGTLSGKNTPGWAPLHFAAVNGETELVQWLVLNGADVNMATAEGSTPLFLAELEGYDKIVTVLKRAGARN